MGDDWTIEIRVAPHSTGRGQIEDQKTVGKELQVYNVLANDIDTALIVAKSIRAGIESNPMVWRTEIVGIIQKDKLKDLD